MWLLTTSDPNEPSLVWVDGPRDKPYAILSHTWKHGHEVTFQEMRNGGGRQKSGYSKIKGTCIQAAKDGYDYVWIDTVCINKESSAELAEAINSMWHWYCDAKVCYALLDDISASCPILRDIEDDWVTDTLNDPESHTAWPKKFAASRWFGRGWTLQELLAPQSLTFFGRGWNKIGTKTSLLNRLHSVTEIDKLALEDRDAIRQFVIARRMCWAAKRVTSRIEDRAYSLLGIFGVNMPMLYGEGERAFIRLQEELTKSSTDHSIFAWEWSSNRTIRADLLFATSPDQFYPHGKRMIYWVGNLTDHPFTLTNRGVEFQRISMQEKKKEAEPANFSNEAWVILNCRHENDSNGIALRLVQQDEITARINPLALSTSTAYWISSQSNESRLQRWKQPYPLAHHCTLLRHHLAMNWDMRMPPKFRIRFAKGSGSAYAVKSGWPTRLWQPGCDMLCLPPQSTYPDYVVASASIGLKGKLSPSFVHLAICFHPVAQDGRHRPRLALSRKSQEEARARLPPSKESRESSLGRTRREGEGEATGAPENTESVQEASQDVSDDAIASARLVPTVGYEFAVLAKIANRHRVPENAVYNVEIALAGSEAEFEANEMHQRRRPTFTLGPRNHRPNSDLYMYDSSGESDASASVSPYALH